MLLFYSAVPEPEASLSGLIRLSETYLIRSCCKGSLCTLLKLCHTVPECGSAWEEEFKKVLMRVPSIISYNEKKMYNNTSNFFSPILLLLRLMELFFLIKHFILFIIISVVLLSKCLRVKRGDCDMKTKERFLSRLFWLDFFFAWSHKLIFCNIPCCTHVPNVCPAHCHVLYLLKKPEGLLIISLKQM